MSMGNKLLVVNHREKMDIIKLLEKTKKMQKKCKKNAKKIPKKQFGEISR
jgi:DNA-binding protein YbaB